MLRIPPSAARLAGSALLAMAVAGCSRDETERDYGAPTAEQEVALGLQAAPALAEQYGGLIDAPTLQLSVDSIGAMLATAAQSAALPYGIDVHVLADSVTANVLSLPGGQVFITFGLVIRTMTRSELAAILAHEVAHLAHRHSAKQLAGISVGGRTGAAVIASYAPEDQRSRTSEEVGAMIDALMHIQYSEQEEIDADELAVDYLLRVAADIAPDTTLQGVADPAALLAVLRRLAAREQPRGVPAAFLATHPITTPRLSRLNTVLSRSMNQ